MSQTSAERDTWRLEGRAVGIGAAAGLLGGLGMGVLLQLGTDLLMVFGRLVGEASLVRGWVVHLFVSATYGVIFAAIMGYPTVRRLVAGATTGEYALAGLTYAVMMAAVSIGLLPFVFAFPWVPAAGTPAFGRVPGPGLGGLVPGVVFTLGHVVYGVILGTAWGLSRDRFE